MPQNSAAEDRGKLTRVNKAKEKIERAINEQIDAVSDDIKSEMEKLDYEQHINASYAQF